MQLNGFYILLNYMYMQKINPSKSSFTKENLHSFYMDFQSQLFVNS